MKKMIITLLYIILFVIAVIIIAFAVDRDGFWQRLAGKADLGQTDFQRLRPAKKPNQGLICPKDFCPNRTPDMVAPIYEISAKKLSEELISRLAQLENTMRVDDKSNPLKLRYLTRTPLMRYPDTNSIEIISLGKNRSTMAIHARAQLGYTDKGNNLARIKNWLKQLKSFEE